MIVNCNSQSMLHWQKIRHFIFGRNICIHYHFVRDEIDDGLNMLLKIYIDANLADVLMKPVIQKKLNWNKAFLGLGAI